MYLAMRGTLIICIFYILINIVVGDDESFKISPHIIKSYPKQMKKYPNGLQVKLNNRRYMKKNTEVPLRTKKHIENSYTVFPMQNGNIMKMNVPDSPYFPFDRHADKPSVKKVLPNYEWTARKKRSAEEKDDDIEIKKVKNDVAQTTDSPKETVTTNEPVKETVTTNEPVKETVTTNAPVQDIKESTVGQDKVSVDGKVTVSEKKSNESLSRRSIGKKRGTRIPPKNPSRQKFDASKDRKNTKKTAPKGDKRTRNDGKKHKSNGLRKPLKQEKGKKMVAARRLIAARDAIIEEYPYVVSIQKDGEHWCSGALLNQRLVVTTANCVWKASRMSRLRVRAGSRFSDRGGQLAKIQEVMKHPGWSIRGKPDYDLALMLLDRNIRFSHSVHGVDLPNRVMMPPFEDAWITSWGAERRDGIFEKTGLSLQAYHARLMDKDKCNNVTKRYGILVSDNFMCLAQSGKRAPCTRDTGAPAVSDGVLWGLASWGIRKLCGTERFPAMFSYVASNANMDFIMNATRFLMADERHYPFGDRYVYPVPPKETSRRDPKGR